MPHATDSTQVLVMRSCFRMPTPSIIDAVAVYGTRRSLLQRSRSVDDDVYRPHDAVHKIQLVSSRQYYPGVGSFLPDG